MKSKLLLSAALVALLAAGCNKAAVNTNDNQSADQSQQSDDANKQGIAVGEPNPSGTAQDSNPSVSTDQRHFSGEEDADAAPAPEVVEVKMTANGFSPASITIRAGDYVQFTNADTVGHWPASDPHPTHTDYPGFDAKAAVQPGANYRFQFTKTGTWGYHDHTHPTTHGTVIVQ